MQNASLILWSALPTLQGYLIRDGRETLNRCIRPAVWPSRKSAAFVGQGCELHCSIRAAKEMAKRRGRTTKRAMPTSLPRTPLMQVEASAGSMGTGEGKARTSPDPSLCFAQPTQNLTYLTHHTLPSLTTLPPPAPPESCSLQKLLKPSDPNPIYCVFLAGALRTSNVDCEPTPAHFAAHLRPRFGPPALVRKILCL
jgi:hypothetical protein